MFSDFWEGFFCVSRRGQEAVPIADHRLVAVSR